MNFTMLEMRIQFAFNNKMERNETVVGNFKMGNDLVTSIQQKMKNTPFSQLNMLSEVSGVAEMLD